MESQIKTNASVFIIEDNLVLSMIVKRLVSGLGYEVVGEAKSGEDAVEQIKILKPEIVLSDIRLDGIMNGIETIRKARDFADFEAIFISGSADDNERLKAEEIGYLDYLLKPVRKMDLANALKKAKKITRKKSGHQNGAISLAIE
ncbi:MAG: response regulator [Balneolaceae bacterium]